MTQPITIINYGTINMNGDIHINCEESGISALKEIQAAAARAAAAADDLEKTPWVSASLNAEKEEIAAKAAEKARRERDERRERLKQALIKMPPSLSQILDCIKNLQQTSGNKVQKLSPSIYKKVESEYKEWWDSIDSPKAVVRDTLQMGTVELGWIDGKSYTGKGVGQSVFGDLKANRNKKCIWRVKKGCYSVMTPDELASLRINYSSDKLNEYIEIILGDKVVKYQKTKSTVTKIK